MSEFELLFSVFSLLIGLIVAEISMRLADAIDAHPEQRIGLLTPLLAAFVLLDAIGFWIWAWSARAVVALSWPVIFGTFAMLLIYFLSAALVFPRRGSLQDDLDEHYWRRKRLVIGGILSVNLLALGAQLTRAIPRLSDTWFFVGQSTYLLPMLVLLFTRRPHTTSRFCC